MSQVESLRTPHGQASRALLRRSVLDAVHDLLEQRPWADITMAHVASRAGVSRQSVYNEFGSRDDLVQAYVLWAAEHFLDDVERVVTDHRDDLHAALVSAFDQFLAIAAAHPLLRALEAASGAEGVRALVASSSGEPVVRRGTDRLAGIIAGTWPGLPATDGRDVAEVIVRLAISHLVIPTHPSSEAAAAHVGRVLRPEVDRLAIHLDAEPARWPTLDTGHT